MEFQRLSKVVKGDMGRLALACDVNLQRLRYETSALLTDHRRQLHLLHKAP